MIRSALKNKCPVQVLLLLLLATATKSSAQQFGGNPPSIKWEQVKTPAAKVIFPKGLDSLAFEVADIIRRMNDAIKPTIGTKQKQVSIVLQNQTTVANAYVGLAPFRSEFYLTPEQNSFEIGSLPWASQLSIHEFRHVQQYNNFNVGFSRFLRILFGEGGQALGNDLAIPNWFFEGDAVFNETLVSEQGRGRLPYFFNGYRALWAAGKDYSWMKLRNGSYRDYIPDWYPMGYMLVAYGREKYGDNFWRKVTQDAAAFTGGVYPLQHAVKKYAGVSYPQFRNDALDHFKKEFGSDGKNTNLPEHFVANEEYPAFVNDSTLIYMKSTYDRLPAFVIKTGNKEKSIRTRDASLDNYFAYHNGKIIYAAYRSDLRWTYRDYSELQLLDVATGKEKRLTKSSKYFAPDFSPDGKTIVAVQVGPSGKSEIHLLSAVGGKRLQIVANSDKLFFTYPKFYGEDKLISAVRNVEGKMSVAEIDIKTGQVKYLVHFTFEPIAFLKVKDNLVYYTQSGWVDDLFCYDLVSGKKYWLPNPENHGAIGYYQPAVAEHKLAWVGFTADGYKITEINRKSVEWFEVKDAINSSVTPDMGIAALHNNAAAHLLDSVKQQPLPVAKYPKTYHLFNFHSIIPTISDPDYSIAIIGENVLNTFQSQISFGYNRDEGYKDIGFDAIYGAWFPFIRMGLDYTIDRKGFFKTGNIYWNEVNIHGGLQFPFNLSRGRQITGLSFGTDVYYSQANFHTADIGSSRYTYLNNYVRFATHIQQARQNIYPRFGQSISLNYKNAITGLTASQFLASGNFFFPGLAINHNLVINAAHQQKGDDNQIDFTNSFPFARGYVAENLYSMNKIGADYHFPIAYPDKGAANTIYFLRLRGDLFYDCSRVSDAFTVGEHHRSFRSAGAAIFFDTQWFNQVPISFGFRYDRLLDPDVFGGSGRNRFEIILPVAVF
ncbi:TolB family protein [Mucilaginibacter ginsenosidivorans]|uniref:Uncharacterized protein n=1 Tax=Mucilaginibacter ginsenosidivorans TaxID=398053 RepID=A0A5B8V022_9SPHI|nr:PD40 domain-containing protein [Mucilaginibacter ginsenosidivorans]QEC63961.1 hypothetical protein FRZ54_15720 [Mucilaginibacter ginsenosidivorans]